MAQTNTIKTTTIRALQRKRPLTYEGIVAVVQKAHPDCNTSVKTVQWYASRLRAAGEEVRVKLANERRDWTTRPDKKPAKPAAKKAADTQ